MRLKVKRSASGSNHRSRARRGVLSLALAATAILALAFAASAQAVEYQTSFFPLETEGRASSVAVDQSNGDVYAANIGAEGASSAFNGAEGSVKLFNAAGVEQTCTLSPAPEHPSAVAVDPSSGALDVINAASAATKGERRAYASGCGAELAATTGTADTTSGSKELTSVTMSHPLLVGQAVSGAGIPAATGTASVANGSKIITLESSSGTFAVGQRVNGGGIPGGTTLAACLPSCAAPTELELSASAAGATKTEAVISARTTVVTAAGSTAELSSAAEATGASVAISGNGWPIETAISPYGQLAVGLAGNIYFGNTQTHKLQKLTPWGEELGGGFPVTTEMEKTGGVALDAKGDVFVATSGSSGTFTCTSNTAAKLKKLGPNGADLPEGGAITGEHSEFAGLTEHATTVAVDKSTGNVYVGRNCQATFKIEVYGPGGTMLTEFGSGEFASAGFLNSGVLNNLAVDEETGTVYAADPGHNNVQVFENTSAQKTLSTSVSGGPGEVQCNETEAECLSEYDEGQEVIVEATGENFEEWNGGTGSAEACNGSTETSCTFMLEANSSINAAYGAGTPEQPLTLKINEGEGTVVSNPAGITCTGSSGKECSAEFEEGAEVTLTASPAAGYRFQSWQKCSGGLNGRQCTVTMSEAKEVGVKFKKTFNLSVAKTGSGLGVIDNTSNGVTCTNRCTATTIPFPQGATTTLYTVVPNKEFYFKEFTGGTGSATVCDGTTECTLTVGEDSSVEAKFDRRPEATLTITKEGGGQAKISGPIFCNESCSTSSGSFFSGQPTAKEVPVYWDLYEGTSSIEWTSGAGTCTGKHENDTGSCKVTMSEAHELVAKLE